MPAAVHVQKGSIAVDICLWKYDHSVVDRIPTGEMDIWLTQYFINEQVKPSRLDGDLPKDDTKFYQASKTS